MWKRVGSILRFCYDNEKYIVLDSTCFATGNHLKYLLAILNSDVGCYLLQDAPKTGTGDLLISVQAIEPLKIPNITAKVEQEIIDLVDILLSSQNIKKMAEIENKINKIIYDLYNFDQNEIQQIEHIIHKNSKKS